MNKDALSQVLSAFQTLESKVDKRIDSVVNAFQTLESKVDKRIDSVTSAFQTLEAKVDKRIDIVVSAFQGLEAKMDKRMDSLESKVDSVQKELKSYIKSDSLITETEINNFIYEHLKETFKGYLIEPYHTQLASISHPTSKTKMTDFDGLYKLSLIQDKQIKRRTYSSPVEEELHMKQIEDDAHKLQSQMNWMKDGDPSDLTKREDDLIMYKKALASRKPKARDFIFVIVEAKRHIQMEHVTTKLHQLASLRNCIALSKTPSSTELSKKFKMTCETHGLKDAREVHLVLGSLMWDVQVERRVKELQASDVAIHIAKPMKRFEMVGGRMAPKR